MKVNEGTVDRVLRVVVGIAVLSLWFFLPAPRHYWALIGLVPLFTGLVGVCPMYALLGIRTCPVDQSSKQ